VPTRHYFPLTGTPDIAPAVDAAWERSIASFTRFPTSTTKQNTPLTDITALFGATTTSQTCWRQWITDQLDSDQTISGTVSIVVRGLEANLAEDCHLAFSLRAITPSLAVRGTLALQHAAATEWAVTAQTRIFSGLAITSTPCLAGDRLVMEVGMHGVTPANANNLTMRFGDPTAVADFALTSGLTTDLVPWWELSQNLTFGPPTPVFVLPGGHPWRRRNILRRL
jgi:hypothetical protein